MKMEKSESGVSESTDGSTSGSVTLGAAGSTGSGAAAAVSLFRRDHLVRNGSSAGGSAVFSEAMV
jgi:hypothetical protein